MFTLLLVGGVVALAIAFACVEAEDRSRARQDKIKQEAGDPLYAPVILITPAGSTNEGGNDDGIC